MLKPAESHAEAGQTRPSVLRANVRDRNLGKAIGLLGIDVLEVESIEHPQIHGAMSLYPRPQSFHHIWQVLNLLLGKIGRAVGEWNTASLAKALGTTFCREAVVRHILLALDGHLFVQWVHPDVCIRFK